MCGILAFFDRNGHYKGTPEELKELLVKLSFRQTTRGPDGSGHIGGQHWGLCHERLAIMDPDGGKQPISYPEEDNHVVVNGEIYNFRELLKKYGLEGKTGSDSESILLLYRHLGKAFVSELNGIFGFVITSNNGKNIFAARDHCGIKPLYMGKGKNGEVWFASELKCIVDQGCESYEEFPSGHMWNESEGYERWYNPVWMSDDYVPKDNCDAIRSVLEKAVRDQCMSDVPFGLLLSGGLDSAVVAVILKPIMEELGQTYHTFSVGMEGSPDITAARLMSKYLGTTHHEHPFNSDEAFAVVEDVIYHLETYEPELIRSAIPNYFLARMTSKHVKMVLTGEGSDELFAGYLYFRDAPNAVALQTELKRITHSLQFVNCKRADRMTMAHGLEARVPFLQPDVIDAVMKIDPELKTITKDRPAEKHALRQAFEGTMPSEVLWRTKAMQCEGIGMTWVAELQSRCNKQVSDEEFANRATTYPINTPHTKEELYYRRIFEKSYKGMDKFVHVWEGGCRAGGAAWQNEAYTREGLKDVKQLAQGLGIDTDHVDAHAERLRQEAEVVTRERTYIMIKPDGVQRGLVGEIVKRFERKGLKLVGMKLAQPGAEQFRLHYADLAGKGFFNGLIDYASSGPVCCMVWEGDNAVLTGRKMLGATKPFDSAPGTIRGDYCIHVGRNICHGSDSVESANKEIALWFKPEELLPWNSHSEAWVYE